MHDCPCYLLSLPPELRNRIYQLALVKYPHIEVVTFRYCTVARQPPLTRTCRQIRNESLLMFHQLNTFRFILHRNYTRKVKICFDFIESHISELRHIEIASRHHYSYLTLELGGKDSQNRRLKMVTNGSCICDWYAESCVFTDPKVLASGEAYLQSCERTADGGLLLDAETLKMLIAKLESLGMDARG